jgi:uncharacterized protein with HEPN domain
LRCRRGWRTSSSPARRYFDSLQRKSSTTRIARSDTAAAAHLGDFPRIIAFRNQLAHNYPNVDDAAVWLIVQREVPVLLERVRTLLDQPS